MPRAVRFNHCGGIDVLQVVEVDRPIGAAASSSGTRLLPCRANSAENRGFTLTF